MKYTLLHLRRFVSLVIACCFLITVTGPISALAEDVSGHWAANEINLLREKNIVRGDSNGNINPDKNIMRAEFAAIINRAFEFTQKGDSNFPDVKPGTWYYDDFAIAKREGYIGGDNSGNANPDKLISRAEAAVIFFRVLELEAVSTASTFSDSASFPNWSVASIIAMAENELIKGYPDHTFRASNNITRAETFSILARIIDAGEKEHVNPQSPPRHSDYDDSASITIGTQPTAPPAEALIQGNISGSLTIAATVSRGAAPTYQWYSNTSSSASGGTAIGGATSPSFTIPADLTEGTYYYYCVVSAPDAAPVTSNVVTVTITAPPMSALPVLFEHGQWAPELGKITVHTPGGASTWAYENGLIRITNGIPTSKNVAFRFVFEKLVDMRGYDAVIMELEDAPTGWFGAILRFRIDQDACWAGEDHTNVIRMASGTNVNNGGMVGMSAGNWDLERLRGVGGLPAYGETVRIKRIYLEGDGEFPDTTISTDAQNLMDIIPPRTGNTPVTAITTSSQYSATVEWSPNHDTFQPDTVYTATITLTPKRGWTLDGVPANWFRLYYPTGGAVQVTHEAGSGVLTHTFPATRAVLPYPDPTQFVALTFDDVYLSDTEALVDVLDRYGIKGTFLANGNNLEKAETNPLCQRALDKLITGGHEIETHLWQHERYDNTADESVTAENFQKNQDYIFALTGVAPRWSRIPYASHGTMSLRVAGTFGLSNLRGLATNDWDFPNSVSRLVNTVITATGNNSIRDGQIYVCHDQPGQTNTVEAIPEYYHELRSRGVGFMTINELRAYMDFTANPGVNYNNFFQNSSRPQIITIGTQPVAPAAGTLAEGSISGSLTVVATTAQGAALTYQWYITTAALPTVWTAIDGATSATCAVPTDLAQGAYYFYCKAGASNAPSKTTDVIAVTISEPVAPPELPVLFENGKWAAELGEITVHTPGGTSTVTEEDGMISLYNGITGPTSKNIPFRFVFENLVDMKGYDAVIMELEDAPTGWFRGVLRFRIDQDAAFDSLTHTNIIRMLKGTSTVVAPGINIGFSAGNWDLERLRGVGALADGGQIIKIKKVYLEGSGVISTPATINRRNIRDIIPPRTGNTPVTSITTSSQYTGTVEWSPNHATFQPDTVYTATVTLTPNPGWTLEGVAANWFSIYTRTGTGSSVTGSGTTHAANSGVITKTFPATTPVVPYPDPTQFVALTFDDTLSPNTNDLLDVLDGIGVKATFFVIGNNIEKRNRNPEYERAFDRLKNEGHEIGNHTWQHERWTNADPTVMMTDFTKNQNYINELTGKNPTWIRFPYNDQNAAIVAAAGNLGLSNLWGFDTNDWDIANSVSYIINRYLTQTNANNSIRNGQIYVHHDQQDHQTSTKQALPEIAHELRSRGVDFLTASEMRELNHVAITPGTTYNNFFLPSRITIGTQPAAITTVTEGSISGSLEVTASVTPTAALSYQWRSISNTVWVDVDGATGPSFTIPTDLTAGTYYFYCVVSAPNAAPVTSNVVIVTVT